MIILPNIKHIFSILEQTIINPKTELQYSSNFEFLIAAILSAQTTDKQVNKVTYNLFQKANTPIAVSLLTQEELMIYLKSIGLYKVKAKYISETSKILVRNFQSIVPKSRQYLESLPGVGRKVANVVLNNLFDVHVIAVDTHVFRVANRLGIVKSNNRFTVEKELYKIVPIEFHKTASDLLVLHGRYTCKARAPLCISCPLSMYCAAFKQKIA